MTNVRQTTLSLSDKKFSVHDGKTRTLSFIPLPFSLPLPTNYYYCDISVCFASSSSPLSPPIIIIIVIFLFAVFFSPLRCAFTLWTRKNQKKNCFLFRVFWFSLSLVCLLRNESCRQFAIFFPSNFVNNNNLSSTASSVHTVCSMYAPTTPHT